jgi:CBS domain-containing protein
MRVADVLKGKSSAIKSIAPDATIKELADRLRLEEVGAMIVRSNADEIDGIVTERDVVRGFSTFGGAVESKRVSELMTRRVVTCSPDDPISQIARIMTERRIRHLPVREAGQIVGIVSIGDVLKRRIDEMQLEAAVLRDYAVAHR